jgi:THO complex subunit 2
VDEESTVIERAKIAWKKVLGLIGYFDLDPNRALDIVLDMFISHVATHHAFFLALLRHSPWCRSARRNEPSASMEGLAFEQILQAHEEFSCREGNESPICAQIIGFKFAHYQVIIGVIGLLLP